MRELAILRLRESRTLRVDIGRLRRIAGINDIRHALFTLNTVIFDRRSIACVEVMYTASED